MPRTAAERVADVRRLLAAARRVFERRAELVPALVSTTGLSREGVELGFESLEREATDDELRALVQAAGDARHVHVVLSANVFVAALRALALACAAAPRVTIRPSPRDPILARALVEAVQDPAISLCEDRDVAASGADVVHAYGRDETVARVREQVRAGVRVVGHGAGLGVAWLTGRAPLSRAAGALARDVAAFEQRGCLSPRVALVQGDAALARAFAVELDAKLAAIGLSVPRGALSSDERAEANRWRDAVVFAGELWTGSGHAVALALVPGLEVTAIGPPGRHVLVVPVADPGEAQRALAPLARLVVTVGSDDPASAARVAPSHARIAEPGRMQRPPLDGPVDRRTTVAVT